MLTYLENGWFDAESGGTLQAHVLDGAIDMAGSFIRAEISVARLQRTCLEIRRMIALITPDLTLNNNQFTQKTVDILAQHLTVFSEDEPPLLAFLLDAVDHVRSLRDLIGLYIHTLHIAHMIILLSATRSEHPTLGA
ncbi:MAG TPA: hypothetical protein EYO58_06635 [Flavobacteriales bacterium]|nr:hypothetical protein [Flavobacteriales bacterium]